MNAALGLADSPARAATAGTPTPIKLRTARDFSLTTTALEHRVEDLKKRAKGVREDGYINEARVIEGDAGAIQEFILPQFKEQRELPLVTHDDLQATVKNALHATIHRFAVSSDSAAKNDVGVRANIYPESQGAAEKWQGKREADLSTSIARAVASFAVEIAESSYAAGLAAREMTPLALAKRSSFALADSIGE